MIKAATLIFLSIIFSVLSERAEAMPCPSPNITEGFGQTYTGTTLVSGFIWDREINWLYVINISNTYWTYINFTEAGANAFANTKTPDAFFLQGIAFSAPTTIEAETCATLMNENGAPLLNE